MKTRAVHVLQKRKLQNINTLTRNQRKAINNFNSRISHNEILQQLDFLLMWTGLWIVDWDHTQELHNINCIIATASLSFFFYFWAAINFFSALLFVKQHVTLQAITLACIREMKQSVLRSAEKQFCCEETYINEIQLN